MFSDGGGGNKQHVGGRDSAAVCRDTEETKSKLVFMHASYEKVYTIMIEFDSNSGLYPKLKMLYFCKNLEIQAHINICHHVKT